MTEILPTNWLPALLVFLAVAAGVTSIAFLSETLREGKRRRDFRRQLKGVASGSGDGPAAATQSVLRQTDRTELPLVDNLLQHLPQTRDVRLLLEQADMNWSVGTFFTICFGLAVALGVSVLVISPVPLTALLGAAFGFSLPFLQVKRLKRKRVAAFEEQFPEAIDLLGRSIRAGHAFATGLKVVAEESPDPVGAEFRQVFEEQKFGLPLEDSLLGLADRIDLVDVRIFVTAILVQREVGGNLAEILDKISYTIRERFTIKRQIRVYTAQGRMTGYLLAVLPIILGFLIYALNAEYMSILFVEPVGRLLIAIAAILQVVGFFIIRRIVDIEI